MRAGGRRHERARLGLSTLIAIFLVVSASTAASAAEQGGWHLRYDVYWKFLHLVSVDARAVLGRDGYRVEVDTQTVGLTDVFLPWRARQEVLGKIESSTILQPGSYHAWSQFRGKRQDIEVAYLPDGNVRTQVKGSTTDGEREPVTSEMQQGTIDPLTASAALSALVAATGGCDGTWRIFDGVRRYDLRYADFGEQAIPDDSLTTISGPARLCEARVDVLGGFDRERQLEGESLQSIRAWIARPMAGADPVPVHLVLTAPRGELDVYLVEVKPSPETKAG